jgi:glycosyltransferase involved in cell wall biosynthesis
MFKLRSKPKHRKVTIVSPIAPYPPNHGAGRRIWDIASFLIRSGVEVTVVWVRGSIFTRNPPIIRKLDGLTYLECPLWHRLVLRHLLDSDVIQFEYPFFPYLMLLMRIFKKVIILDQHGVEYHFWKSIAPIDSLKEYDKDDNIIKKICLAFMHHPWIVYVLEMLSIIFATYVFIVSKNDLKDLVKLYRINLQKVRILPNCVNTRFFEENIKPYGLSEQYVLFLGSFDHPPNIYATRLLINQIIPKVLKKVHVTFMFVGRRPPRWLKDGYLDGVIKVVGDVEDVRTFIAGASVAVAPIYHGSGTRVKILEYMAMGKPVVSTTKGAEGLDITDGVNIIIRDDPEQFAEAIVYLLKDRKRAAQIGQEAKKLVMDKYLLQKYMYYLLEVYKCKVNENSNDKR